MRWLVGCPALVYKPVKSLGYIKVRYLIFHPFVVGGDVVCAVGDKQNAWADDT